MPLYEYRCAACGHVFEKIQSFTAPETMACPKCGSTSERLLSAPAIQFKGSGFYLTDYGKAGTGAGKGEGGAGKSGSDASAPAAKNSDSGSAASSGSAGGSGSVANAPSAPSSAGSTSGSSSAPPKSS